MLIFLKFEYIVSLTFRILRTHAEYSKWLEEQIKLEYSVISDILSEENNGI